MQRIGLQGQRFDCATGDPAELQRRLDLLEGIHLRLGQVTWIWDVERDATDWYGDMSPLLGLPPGSFGGTYAHYLAALHPADREVARLRMAFLFQGEEVDRHGDERVVWPDGSVHWLNARSFHVKGADGRVLRVCGVVRAASEGVRLLGADTDPYQRFRQLIEQLPMPICIVRGDTFAYANQSFADMFGYESPQQVVGTPVLERVAPAEREAHRKRIMRRQAGQPEPSTYERLLARRDGSVFPVLLSVARIALPDGPGVLAFHQDLTEALQAQRELEAEQQRAARYFEVAQAILVAIDRDGCVSAINSFGQRLLGWTETELRGRLWFDFCVPEEQRTARRSVWDEVMQGLRPTSEGVDLATLTRDGRRLEIAWRATLLHDGSGAITGAVCSGVDVTEERRVAARLRGLNAELEQRVHERTHDLELARDEAQAAVVARGRFVAHMSHEIRTPMNAIIGMSDLALRLPSLGERARSYLANIRRASQALLEIINDILDFSKIDAGQLHIEPRSFDLSELLHRTLSVISVRAVEKGLSLRMQVDPQLPRQLVGDDLRLGQVMINLCSNAVKFTDAGHVQIEVVQLERGDDQVRVRFSVRDTGVGIAAADCARLFQPFSQVDTSSTRRFGGTGLGLAISRQLIELMGGHIGVSSVPGEGSEFSFELPLQVRRPATLPNSQTPGSADPEAFPAAARLRGARLLVVEDNELNQIIAHDLLSDVCGAQVTLARNGREALDRLNEDDFDAVLMDVEMPEMDGYEATRRLRADPRWRDLPIVAATAHAMPHNRDMCLAAGMSDFVSKPFDPQLLIETLARYLPHRAVPAAAATVPAPTAVAADEAPSAVDFGLGLRRAMGLGAVYQAVLRQFMASEAPSANRLREAHDKGDRKVAARLAHAMVSSAGAVGATTLQELARELQLALEARPDEPQSALIERYEAELERVLVQVGERLTL